MNAMQVVVVSASLATVLTGCLTVSRYAFSLDFNTGELRREYIDVTSRPGPDEKDYSVGRDWARLKQMVAGQKAEFAPEVVRSISRELFERDKMLCARTVHAVVCPKCFPSKAAMLSYVHDKEWRFELINGEVILFLPAGKKVISTNGQTVTTAKNSMIIWPLEADRAEYVVSEPWSGGTSLLSYYLQDSPEQR